MTLTGSLDFWLRQGTALRSLYEKAEPNLLFTQFVNPIQEQDNAFIYSYDDTGMAADAKKQQPAHVKIGGDFPEVDISRQKYTPGLIESRGFTVRIKYEQIRNEPRGISEVQKAYKFAAFWMADFINSQIATTLTTGATTPTWTPTSVWSATATATPIKDIVDFKNAMKREGYEYRMTDIFGHMTSLTEIESFLLGSDIASFRDAALNAQQDALTLPIEGKPVFHGCFSGITDGYLLGVDRNNPAAEYHYYVDPKFGSAQVQYDTIVNGQKTKVTAQNLGINFKTWTDEKSEDQILKFWCEGAAVVNQPYAALYDSGV